MSSLRIIGQESCLCSKQPGLTLPLLVSVKKWFLAAASCSLGEGLRMVAQTALDVWLGLEAQAALPRSQRAANPSGVAVLP